MSLLKPIFGASSKSSVNKTNKWEDELQSIYDQNINREKFSYDMNADALYKQYAQQYEQNAKLAMQDTVGQVSALTGGYGNSYAQTAGQAVYNQQMSGMNDKALQLYQMALNQYNAEGDRLMQMYGITADQYQTEYNRIRDEIADEQWQKSFEEQQRQYNLGLAMDAAGMAIDVGKFGASMAFDVSRAMASDAQWAKSFDYQKERDLVGDARWQQSFDYQKERDGISDAQFQKELDYKYAALAAKGDGLISGGLLGGGLISGGYITDENNAPITREDVIDYLEKNGLNASNIVTKEMYEKFNVTKERSYEDYLAHIIENRGGVR